MKKVNLTIVLFCILLSCKTDSDSPEFNRDDVQAIIEHYNDKLSDDFKLKIDENGEYPVNDMKVNSIDELEDVLQQLVEFDSTFAEERRVADYENKINKQMANEFRNSKSIEESNEIERKYRQKYKFVDIDFTSQEVLYTHGDLYERFQNTESNRERTEILLEANEIAKEILESKTHEMD